VLTASISSLGKEQEQPCSDTFATANGIVVSNNQKRQGLPQHAPSNQSTSTSRITMPPVSDIKHGYPGLAKLMGASFDQGFGIFNTFSELNARNLLTMQAELLDLENQLKTLTFFDEHCQEPTRETFARECSKTKSIGTTTFVHR